MNEIDDLLRRSAERWPNRPAVIDDAGAIDYETLSRRAEIARRELAASGLGQGQFIAVMFHDGWEFIAYALGAVACGAVVMPVSHRLTRQEVEDTLTAASAHALLMDARIPCDLEGRENPISLDGEAEARLIRPARQTEGSLTDLVPDAAFVRFTSGTTGASKGVVLSHTAIRERIAAANRGLGLGPEDTVLWVLPMAYHFFVSILLYLRYGVTIVICREHLARVILEKANRHRATFMYAAPLHCQWLASDTSGLTFSHMTRVISTSTALQSITAARFLPRYGLPITQAYGIIEVGLPIVNLEGALEKPMSVGRPLPDFEVEILDDDLRPVPDGTMGQLGVRGPGMFSAYMQPPRPTSSVLQGGWFLTADLATRDADGDITIVGRASSIINVAGEKVIPEEVQEVLNRHPAVAGSRVLGRASSLTGETVHAEVQLRRSQARISTAELIAFCRRQLSSLKVPQSLQFVDDLPLTSSGKIRRF